MSFRDYRRQSKTYLKSLYLIRIILLGLSKTIEGMHFSLTVFLTVDFRCRDGSKFIPSGQNRS